MEREGERFDEMPLMLGETVGWRAWNVIAERSQHPRLQSATHTATMWPTNAWTIAECSKGHAFGHVPVEQCSCGLYAAADLEHLLEYGYARWNASGFVVVGQVGFAGKVIPGAQGWRGARGRIVRLYVPFSQAELGGKLSKAYNVPVEFGPWWATDPRLGIRRTS